MRSSVLLVIATNVLHSALTIWGLQSPRCWWCLLRWTDPEYYTWIMWWNECIKNASMQMIDISTQMVVKKGRKFSLLHQFLIMYSHTMLFTACYIRVENAKDQHQFVHCQKKIILLLLGLKCTVYKITLIWFIQNHILMVVYKNLISYWCTLYLKLFFHSVILIRKHYTVQ